MVPEDPGTTTRAGADHEHHNHQAGRRHYGHQAQLRLRQDLSASSSPSSARSCSSAGPARGSWSRAHPTSVTVPEDADSNAGEVVNGPFTAYSEAMVIEKHALEASGNKTFASTVRTPSASPS